MQAAIQPKAERLHFFVYFTRRLCGKAMRIRICVPNSRTRPSGIAGRTFSPASPAACSEKKSSSQNAGLDVFRTSVMAFCSQHSRRPTLQIHAAPSRSASGPAKISTQRLARRHLAQRFVPRLFWIRRLPGLRSRTMRGHRPAARHWRPASGATPTGGK
jgi:hypothetical protein